MNSPPYVFEVDHVEKSRSELSITILEKIKNYRLKKCPKLAQVQKIFDIQQDDFRNSIYFQYRGPFYRRALGFDPPEWTLASNFDASKIGIGKIYRKVKIEWWRPKFMEKTLSLPHYQGVKPELIVKLIKSGPFFLRESVCIFFSRTLIDSPNLIFAFWSGAEMCC